MTTNNIHNPDVLSCLANLSSDEVFTPPSVANAMLDLLPADIWKDETITFLDPVAKSGVFLREITKRLIEGLEPKFPDLQERIDHILTKQVYGIGITELTALLSRRSLYCSKTANGRYSISSAFDDETGNILFARGRHRWKRGRCVYCGASQSQYDRGSDLEAHAYRFIHTKNPKDIFNMNFDVIVGNPPYQLSDGGFGISAAPIYQHFVNQAKRLQPRFLTMIIPARWYSGGKGLDEFRNGMLNDNKLVELHDFPDATSVFPGVQIKGGVCFFLWNRDLEADCKVVNYAGVSVSSEVVRPLRETSEANFVRFNEAISILKKVQSFEEDVIASQISSRKPFGLDTKFKGQTKQSEHQIKLFQNGGIGYIHARNVPRNRHLLKSWKVFIPRAGSGSDAFPHPILGKPFIGEPNTACTETYIIAGVFDDETEARNLCSYINTRLFRFLVLLNKPSQDATSRVYKYVPKQNFREEWSDGKLFDKYSINTAEQHFISTLIKE